MLLGLSAEVNVLFRQYLNISLILDQRPHDDPNVLAVCGYIIIAVPFTTVPTGALTQHPCKLEGLLQV